MNYKEFVDYIYQRHSGNVKLGLERINNILQLMGNPNKILTGIHIAGTNGKGSTAAMCESLALAHNLTTGLNTSPHLTDYRERIRINGKNIAFEELMNAYKTREAILEQNEASFFEITTALAFDVFLKNNVECAVFEVGLGGRLDGTNPFDATITAITTVSYDHTKSLGNTIEKIAFEKAGIIKKSTPLVIGKMGENAKKVIKKKAVELEAPTYELGKDFTIKNIHITTAGTLFDYKSGTLNLKNIKVNLIGEHQAYNAAVAIQSFELFTAEKNIILQESHIRKALCEINWQGRMQIIHKEPTVIVDGAHNLEGISVLKKNVSKLFPTNRIITVLAILRDKNLESIIKDVCDFSDYIFITKNKSARAAELDEQVEFLKKNKAQYTAVEDVKTACEKALKYAKTKDIVLITGSLYTISEILNEGRFKVK
jgi:dihydrofolate synthase / folylpolyglutamate synthase